MLTKDIYYIHLKNRKTTDHLNSSFFLFFIVFTKSLPASWVGCSDYDVLIHRYVEAFIDHMPIF